MSRRTPRLAAALLALAALAACSDAPTAPAGPTPADAPARSVTPTPTTTTVGTCTGGTIALTADEARTLALHNQQRATLGLVAFCVDPTLTAAARAHSADMLTKGYFSHTGLNGETFAARLVRFGYTPYRMLAENIAYGTRLSGSPDQIFARWMGSAGHKANITNAGLRQIGVGVQAGTYLGYVGARMYTVDFGTR